MAYITKNNIEEGESIVPKPKKRYPMDVKTFVSTDGKRKYIVYQIPIRRKNLTSYHVLMEVEGKTAAQDCGAAKWDILWNQ